MLVDNHVHLYRQPYSLETICQCVETERSRGVAKVGSVEHGTSFRSWWEALDSWWIGKESYRCLAFQIPFRLPQP